MPPQEQFVSCDNCNGQGWTIEHNSMDTHNPEDGSCLQCPIQELCTKCEGNGYIDYRQVGEPKTEIEALINIDDLPF